MLVLKALLLGIVEGVTEFLPISSTGHLIVAARLIDYPEESRGTFEIFIQLGAILAVVWHLRTHLADTVRTALAGGEGRTLLLRVLLAFSPTLVVGASFGKAIQAALFRTEVVGAALLIGGLAILWIERREWRTSAERIEDASWGLAGAVGLAQLLSLVPGVSRSAATIMGGRIAGFSRPAATLFSFYLSIPTMFAASLYSLLKADISLADFAPLSAGFVAAFISALLVVRGFLGYVQQHDFRAFGYYRLVAGVVVLLFL